MKLLTAALVTLMACASAASNMMPSFVSVAFAEIDETTAKVMDIQRALKEFGFYKGKIDGKIKRSLYDAMSKYTAYVRSKGWSDATGELTEEEIAFLLKQYEKRTSELAKDDNGSGSTASSESPSEPSGNGGASASVSGGDESGSTSNSSTSGSAISGGADGNASSSASTSSGSGSSGAP